MARILVTGANGHIGSNVVRGLLARGDEVVAFVRPTADRRSLDGLEVKIATGDVLDRASVDAAVRGADAVIHAAANFRVWGTDDEIVAPSVAGTENVFSAAAEHGVKRVVCTSSCAVAGFSKGPGELRDESDWRGDTHLGYYRAKLDGERTAFACAERLGVEIVSILPTLVLGPHDYRITPSMKPVLDLFNGTGPTVDGGANVVGVKDVAEAHVNALEKGRAGERYIVGGDNLTMKELGGIVARLTGKTPKHLSLPRWAFMTVASLMELGSKLTGKPPSMTRAAVRDVLGWYAWYDCGKAKTELGLDPAPAGQVVCETAQWLLEQGHLEPDVAREVEQRLARDGGGRAAA